MRFSLEKKFVYLAYPKTGSTSVRLMLDDKSDHLILKEKGQYHDHWSAKEYKEVFKSNGWQWNDFYSFLTLRNPWDKYVSNYFYSKPDIEFKPWYENGYDQSTAFRHDFKTWLKHFLSDRKVSPHGCPPLSYFAFDNNQCIVDDLFTIEAFAEKALPVLIEKGIVDESATLPHENTTARKVGYRDYYDEETANLVGDFTSDEVKIGKYEF